MNRFFCFLSLSHIIDSKMQTANENIKKMYEHFFSWYNKIQYATKNTVVQTWILTNCDKFALNCSKYSLPLNAKSKISWDLVQSHVSVKDSYRFLLVLISLILNFESERRLKIIYNYLLKWGTVKFEVATTLKVLRILLCICLGMWEKKLPI